MEQKDKNFSQLHYEFHKLIEAEKVRDCILVSLRDELVENKYHLDNLDTLHVIKDAIDIPIEFINKERKGDIKETSYSDIVKTSRVLEQISLHDFTRKSLVKCGMYIPFPK